MPKLSIIIPVYYNEQSLIPLYDDLQKKVFAEIEDYEIVFVDDDSGDNSLSVLRLIASNDCRVQVIKLSRNFGSHAAILAGLRHCTGDCAVVKAADMQEPSELLLEMYRQWEMGNSVVLAVREKREDTLVSKFFAGIYYGIMRKIAIPNMPKSGFDIYLLDRKVIEVIKSMDEKNTSLPGQVLWCGFKTSEVEYVRQKREVGKSRWTLSKKVKLVIDSMLGFSYFPIRFISVIGILFFVASFLYLIFVFIQALAGGVPVQGWSTLMIIVLFSSGTIMLTLGIIGEYMWRTLDAARNRPVYIIEEIFKEINHTQ